MGGGGGSVSGGSTVGDLMGGDFIGGDLMGGGSVAGLLVRPEDSMEGPAVLPIALVDAEAPCWVLPPSHLISVLASLNLELRQCGKNLSRDGARRQT